MYGVTIDQAAIRSLIQDFYHLTGIRIAFYSHDLKTQIYYPTDMCRFCRILRANPHADRKCRECDRLAFEQALKTQKLYIYECHAGITEAVTPILAGGRLSGFLMMGQTLRVPPTGVSWEKTQQICSCRPEDLEQLRDAFFSLNHLPWDKLESAGRVMDMAAGFIHLSKIARIQQPLLHQKVEQYVEENLHLPISIQDLSKALHLSKSYLSHQIRQETGTSFSLLLQEKRLEKARELLESTDYKVSEIASAVGFEDQNYFSRVFRRSLQATPTQYRSSFRKKAPKC